MTNGFKRKEDRVWRQTIHHGDIINSQDIVLLYVATVKYLSNLSCPYLLADHGLMSIKTLSTKLTFLMAWAVKESNIPFHEDY